MVFREITGYLYHQEIYEQCTVYLKAKVSRGMDIFLKV